MAIDNHVRRGHPIIFGLLLLFGLVELALAAWLTSRFHTHHNAPNQSILDRTHFALFTACWTVFFSLLLGLLFLRSATGGGLLTSVASHGVILALTWIFWSAVAASITAALGGGKNCSKANLVYCDQLNALEAFAWAEWAFTTIAIISVLLLGLRSVRRGDGYRGKLVYA
ncbi:hypothetical protein FA95DRAFT_1574884 [Auriscalpium vulgare]|uniref:Uncharacterized protein n=1 Tax=Auriscalpium vulgare TaxID=40419 RepID=A0ACB8RID7_9AGAM|nr:hypothetical protein FA95DRAFT_1574884 [Auriscalpium vulgare]